VAVGGADAVGAGVAAADDHHVLAGGPELRHAGIARHALVLQRQELHREVHAAQLAARDRQVPGLLGATGEHHGVEITQ
jgi:hypothetical protein